MLLSGEEESKTQDSSVWGKVQDHITDDVKRLYYNLYAYDCTKKLLVRYAGKCYAELKKRAQEKEAEVQAVQKVFRMFTGQSESTCRQIFKEIYSRIDEYIGEVKESIGSYTK